MLHDTPRGACSIEVAPVACSMLGIIQLLFLPSLWPMQSQDMGRTTPAMPEPVWSLC